MQMVFAFHDWLLSYIHFMANDTSKPKSNNPTNAYLKKIFYE